MATEKEVKELIEKSCGIHNCCKISFQSWMKILSCDVFELYQHLKNLIKKEEINIDHDNNIFKTINF